MSAVPGGNPTARADPEHFAVEWLRCGACRSYWCDRCYAKHPSIAARRCPTCLAPLVGPSVEHARDIMLGGAPVGPNAVAVTRVERPAAPPEPAAAKKPWWKFW